MLTGAVFSIPGTLLAKAIMPSTAIAMGCFLWSIAAASMAGTTSFASVVVCRLFIGIGEGAPSDIGSALADARAAMFGQVCPSSATSVDR